MHKVSIYKRLALSRKKMSIGIIDADLLDHGTRHPNLALMKISSFCKSLGHKIFLVEKDTDIEVFDFVFMSKVFSFTKVDKAYFNHKNLEYGGTGFDPEGNKILPFCVEHIKPDYSLYEPWVSKKLSQGKKRSNYADYLDYSIGFSTRGCFRKCEFCVNKKYDHAFLHSPISEFVDIKRPYIYLWDDNFLACSSWNVVLDKLNLTNKPFQFRQGLDIRLLTKEKAKLLSSSKYHGDFIFAFDHVEDKALIEKKLKLWRDTTKRGTRLYVLCAYDSQDEKDIESIFKRIHVLMKYACLPYIMRYEEYNNSSLRSLYITIARWCNQPQFFKKMSFRQFCEANQKYHKNKNTLCSAYKCMIKFEDEFPDIARRYFDLRYEEVKIY